MIAKTSTLYHSGHIIPLAEHMLCVRIYCRLKLKVHVLVHICSAIQKYIERRIHRKKNCFNGTKHTECKCSRLVFLCSLCALAGGADGATGGGGGHLSGDRRAVLSVSMWESH